MGTIRRAAGLLLGSAAIGMGGWSGVALAQDNSAVELAPVVVDANGKKVQDATEVQQDATKTEIGRTVLQQRMAEDFQDIGRSIDAGVNYNRNQRSINLRGLQDDRILTTIDGVRVPWLVDPRDSARGGLNAFDFDGLSEVDIIRGSDSTRYGSGALGGVVQLRTLDPEDLIQDGKNFGGVVKSGYDSADQSWRANAALAARSNDTWMMVQGGYRNGHEDDNFGTVGGYGQDRTEANPRDYDMGNVLVKLHQYVEGGHRFGLTGEYIKRQDDIENMTGTTASYVPGTFQSGEDIERKRISGEYTFESPDKSDPVDAANLVLYWVDQKLNATTDAIRAVDPRSFIIPGDPFMYGYPSGPYKRDNWIKQTNYGLSGNAEKELPLGGLSNTLRFGGELYGQKTTQYSWGEDNCPDVDWSHIPDPFGPQSCRFLHTNAADMPEVDSAFFGVFVEDDIKVTDSVTLTPGLRFDWYDHRPKSTPEFERSQNYDPAYLESNGDVGLSPKLRAAWQATPEVELFAQWSQGFRAPSAKELYQNFANAGQYARLGNPNLDAETSNSFEIGASYEGADYGASINIFNNYYRNFIDEVTLPGNDEYPMIFTYENRERVQIYGAEARGYARFADNWKAWGSIAYSHGKDTETDEYLNSIPPLRAILGLGYERENWGVDVSTLLAAARDKVSGQGTSEAGFVAPGYGVVDISGWWQPTSMKGMKIQAGVYNLFDKKYWDAVSVPEGRPDSERDRYTEAGRSFRLAITQSF